MTELTPKDFVPVIKMTFSCIKDLIDSSDMIDPVSKAKVKELIDAIITPDLEYNCDLESGLKFLLAILEKSKWSFEDFFHVAKAHRYLSELLGLKGAE